MANLVTTPRQYKKKIICFKAETAYGTDSSPSPTVNWIEARNVNFTPVDTETVDRNIELPYLDDAGKLVVAKWAKISFDIAVAPSGTAGTAPKWAPLFLACAMAQTVTPGDSVTFNQVSSALGSATIYINMDGVLHKMTGVRGNAAFKGPAKGIPIFTFTFDAVYAVPADQTPPPTDTSGWMLEEVINAANTSPLSINGVDLAFSQFDWDLGNNVTRVNMPGPQVEIQINSRKVTASATVIAVPHGTFNPFALMDNGDVIEATFTHGKVAGKKFQTDILTRILKVGYTEVEGMTAWSLELDPVPDAGNDVIALTCL